jgi:acyl-CoA dehydrogenase
MSEMRSILVDQVDRLLADLVTKETLEAAERGETPQALWRAMEEQGLYRLRAPEAFGGADGDWSDVGALLRVAGRRQAPAPLAESMIAAALLADAGIDIPDGPMTIAPVRREDEIAVADGKVSGAAHRVPFARAVPHVVVVATGEREPFVALVRTADCEIAPESNVAAEPRDRVTFRDVRAVAAKMAGRGADARLLWNRGAMARACQMAGALEFLLGQSVQYANERVQFGRPIGKFQAIQQQLAVLATHVAASVAASEEACEAADRGEAPFETAVAKIRVGEAANVGPTIAHQVHGAIGFTYEHALHFATRRLWSWRAEFGTAGWWSRELGRQVCDRGADALWPFLTARQ